jgi:GST-like protein
MRTLYTYPTPNGWRASIALEELGLDYTVKLVDLRQGEQYAPDYKAISPISKVPALVDGDEAVFGSTAILAHLAERHGRLMPTEARARTQAHVWLAFAASDLGPTLVNSYHFGVMAPEKFPYVLERFAAEGDKCLAALEWRLGQAEYLAGPEYSIADIACFAFIAAGAAARPEVLASRPALKAWHDRIAARPAVARGMAVPKAG